MATKGEELLTAQMKKHRENNPFPKNTFSREELPTNNKVKNLEKNRGKEKSTTIRCSLDTANSLKALSDVLALGSMNDLIDEMLYSKIDELTAEHKGEYKAMKKIIENKKKK